MNASFVEPINKASSSLEIAQSVPDSSYSLSEVAIIVGLVIWGISKLLPAIKEFTKDRKRENGYKKTEARCDGEVKSMLEDVHSIIAREDTDGQKVFLSIPKYLRGFVESNKRQEKILEDMVGKMTHLVNHQNDIILALNMSDRMDRAKKNRKAKEDEAPIFEMDGK